MLIKKTNNIYPQIQLDDFITIFFLERKEF